MLLRLAAELGLCRPICYKSDFSRYTLFAVFPMPLHGVPQAWCELKMSLTLTWGEPEPTKAMKNGRDRHKALEKEV